jgi:hypothetical protein
MVCKSVPILKPSKQTRPNKRLQPTPLGAIVKRRG